MKKNQGWLGWLFASPYLLYSIVFFLIPLVWSLFLSVTDWNLISPTYNFVGIGELRRGTSKARVCRVPFL